MVKKRKNMGIKKAQGHSYSRKTRRVAMMDKTRKLQSASLPTAAWKWKHKANITQIHPIKLALYEQP
jgi:hypothetical protein